MHGVNRRLYKYSIVKICKFSHSFSQAFTANPVLFLFVFYVVVFSPPTTSYYWTESPFRPFCACLSINVYQKWKLVQCCKCIKYGHILSLFPLKRSLTVENYSNNIQMYALSFGGYPHESDYPTQHINSVAKTLPISLSWIRVTNQGK